MNILLTGATGYLGSHLLSAFLLRGDRVVILKRSHSNVVRIQSILDKVDYIDIDTDPLERAFSICKIDVVIHTATIYGRKGEPVFEIIDTNLNFPLRLMRAAIDHGVHAFINADTILAPFITPYALSKNQFNEWGVFYAKRRDIYFLNVKLQNMYGPGDDETKLIPYVIKNCLKSAASLDFTSGDQTRDFIYIEDVVSAYLTIMDRLVGNDDFEYYKEMGIGTAQSISIKSLVQKIGVLCQATTEFNFGVLEARDSEFESRATDIRFLTSSGWSPCYSLEQGLKKTIDLERSWLE